MNEDRDFLRLLLADPDNDTLRLVYADWLEERDSIRAEFLRLEVELGGAEAHDGLWQRLGQLRESASPRWLAFVDRGRHPKDGSIWIPGCVVSYVRKRPALYIGDLTYSGLHNMVFELLANTLEEIRSGHGSTVRVTVHSNGSVTIGDDGRGIPVDLDPESQMTVLETVMTGSRRITNHTRRASGKGRVGDIGACVVTALSDWCRAKVSHEGRWLQQEYERGLPLNSLTDVGPANGQAGTVITFHPDAEIFREAAFDWSRLETRLRELAFLNRATITLKDECSGKEECLHYPGGVADFVAWLVGAESALHKPISVDRTINGVRVEAALQYTTGSVERLLGFANDERSQWGTHLTGFRRALTRTLNLHRRKECVRGWTPNGEDCRQGLVAVVSVHLADPLWGGSTKERLDNPEVEEIVARVIREALTAFLRGNSADARRIIAKVDRTAHARRVHS